jgi:thiazole tautomerase (transcriptional regulator TenI)
MKLIAVTDGKMAEAELIKTVQAIAPYVNFIILREKQKSPRAYFTFVNRLLAAGVPKDRLCIHEHAVICAITGVNRLHLPENSLPVNKIKQLFPSLTIGVSVHTLPKAVEAGQNGADYVMYGHVYATASKKGMEPRGIKQLEKIISSVYLPVIAIGGINVTKMEELAQVNTDGIAVMSAVFSQENPLEAVKILREVVSKSEQSS